MASNGVMERNGSVALQVFGDEYAAIKNGIAQNLSDTELDYLASVSRSMGLSVLRKQIYGTKRKSKVNGTWQESLVIQVGIDGYRVIAERTGKYGGQIGPYWCGADGEWADVWLDSEPPMAAKVAVVRKDFTEPLWAVATFQSYAVIYEGAPSGLWAKMPEVMLAKCAESLALRKAFPDEMGGTYTEDEMAQADNASAPVREVREASVPIVTARVAPLSEPRKKALEPNEKERIKADLVEKFAAKGVVLRTDQTAAEWVEAIDFVFETLDSDYRVDAPNGLPSSKALYDALAALPALVEA